jgi:hypothetical protein
LQSYHARSEDELRLAALIVAFGRGAIDTLGMAASPDLPPNLVPRLSDNTVALSRAGHQNQRVLDTPRERISRPRAARDRTARLRRDRGPHLRPLDHRSLHNATLPPQIFKRLTGINMRQGRFSVSRSPSE